jgi:BTB/POZ domain-containing protein 9
LFGGMRESQQSEIELKGSSIEAFKGLLRYIYTGHMSLGRMKEEAVLDVLGLAHQYGFVDLEDSVSDYLRQILSVRNACLIFDAARLYQLQFLSTMCFSFMDRHAFEILHQDGFTALSSVSLMVYCETFKNKNNIFYPIPILCCCERPKINLFCFTAKKVCKSFLFFILF